MSGMCQNPQTCCYIASAIGFVAGVIATLIVCKLTCASSKKRGCARPPRKGEERPFEKRKPHPAPADGSTEIYVGNLSYDMTEEQLRAEFEKFGKVNAVRLVMNHHTGKSKGFGFIQMPNRDEVDRACEALNDKEILGRKVKCNVAKNVAD